MRVTALAGLFACAVMCMLNSSQVSAEPLDLIKSQQSSKVSLLEAITNENELEEAAPVEPQAPAPIEHMVAIGDSLSSIAALHNTTWQRLFYKNTDIEQPSLISVGQKIIVPDASEQLAERPIPEPPVPEVIAEPVATTQSRVRAVSTMQRGSVAGNTYTPGYCTWYAKNKRPDLPNNLGNADTWVARAAAQGLPTGSTPSVGAIGQQGMHVVYVESVHGNGMVTISEMNFEGLYVVSTRTVPASNFRYIY